MHWGTTRSFQDFVDTQLKDLQARFGMAMWVLVRRQGSEWLSLRAVGGGYPLSPESRFAWRDSLCCQQIRQAGPSICADIHEVPDYRNTPMARRLRIRAYLGLPLRDQHGQPFGTLCAFDPGPHPQLRNPGVQDALHRQRHLLETALAWNLADLDGQRVSEFFEEEGRDPETGLLDGHGWSRALDRERQRCRTYGLSATILRLHGDTIEPHHREHLADSLAALIREHDMVAHLGDGQFMVLLAETDPSDALGVRSRILEALNAKGLWVRCESERLRLQAHLPQPEVLFDGGEVH